MNGLKSFFHKEDKGTFTLEATLVFPVILLTTMMIIIVSIYIYQQNSLYSAASRSAERASYIWDNSFKHPLTGSFSIVQNDGLYWRIFQDHSWGMFSLINGNNMISIELPKDAEKQNLNLPQQKLMNLSALLPSVAAARLSYARSLFESNVIVRLEHPFRSQQLVRPLLTAEGIHEEARSSIVDPVEFIRTIDFVILYASEFIGKTNRYEAQQWFVEPTLDAPNSFHGHDIDLVMYLQKLVNGKESRFSNINGSNRQVDALDKSGVAHQAYCTYTKNNLLNSQMPKDAYLLKQGAVSGIVWHFFTNCRGKQPKPAKSLITELQRNGIVVVIHE